MPPAAECRETLQRMPATGGNPACARPHAVRRSTRPGRSTRRPGIAGSREMRPGRGVGRGQQETRPDEPQTQRTAGAALLTADGRCHFAECPSADQGLDPIAAPRVAPVHCGPGSRQPRCDRPGPDTMPGTVTGITCRAPPPTPDSVRRLPGNAKKGPVPPRGAAPGLELSLPSVPATPLRPPDPPGSPARPPAGPGRRPSRTGSTRSHPQRAGPRHGRRPA